MTELPTHTGPPGTAAWTGGAPTPLAEEHPAVPFWQMIVLGCVSVLFGIAVLAWPQETVRVLGYLVGVWLLIVGAARIVGAFLVGRGIGRQILSGVVGVFFVIGGVACLRDVAKGVLVLALMVALAWIFTGLTELAVGLQSTRPTRNWLIALAIISIIIGFVFMLWPSLSLTVMIVMTGVSGLIVGVGQIILAFQLRRTASTI